MKAKAGLRFDLGALRRAPPRRRSASCIRGGGHLAEVAA